MYTYLLVLVFALSTERPLVLAPFESEVDCQIAAGKAAKLPLLQTLAARENGAVPICYKMQSPV